MQKLLSWLDDNLIALLAGFLLIFIPLYPKLPLLDVLPGYIVRIRLEDFLIGATVIIWFIWLIRKKITISLNPVIDIMGIYIAVGLLSMVSAVLRLSTSAKWSSIFFAGLNIFPSFLFSILPSDL